MGDNNVSIGGNNFGHIVQAQGDAHVGADAFDALLAARKLRLSATALGLDPREFEGLESALGRPRPDRDEVAERLKRLTTILKTAGALASAGVALTHPLGIVAAWVGHAVLK